MRATVGELWLYTEYQHHPGLGYNFSIVTSITPQVIMISDYFEQDRAFDIPETYATFYSQYTLYNNTFRKR